MGGSRHGTCGSLVMLAVACAAVCAAAGARADDSLEALLEDVGVARHLFEWPEVNAGARERARDSLPPEEAGLLLRQAQAALGAERLLGEVAATLAGALSAETIERLRAGYAQQDAAGLLGPVTGIPASDLRGFPGFASRVARREIPPERFALVARLDEATGFGRGAWRVTRVVGDAIVRGAAALRCEADAWRGPPPVEEAAARRALADPFRERVHLELLFVTRERETRALRRAIRFLESAPVQAFHAQLLEAIGRALTAGSAELRAGLALRVAARCP